MPNSRVTLIGKFTAKEQTETTEGTRDCLTPIPVRLAGAGVVKLPLLDFLCGDDQLSKCSTPPDYGWSEAEDAEAVPKTGGVRPSKLI